MKHPDLTGRICIGVSKYLTKETSDSVIEQLQMYAHNASIGFWEAQWIVTLCYKFEEARYEPPIFEDVNSAMIHGPKYYVLVQKAISGVDYDEWLPDTIRLKPDKNGVVAHQFLEPGSESK
ncbi:hypothetical protein MOD72_12000 [Bacillus haynesii]|uniref:hypothetical protein n=1 Tax=Bacillus haynesii TaxID=1925021 RepID=UPI00228171E6|nr:hypothetical protein [Bacillus haynesii]MCY8609899.1 hypothetical protein [Bacillus haynesii]